MTLPQLQCLCEVVDRGLNLSRAARALSTSQPAVTKMIRALERELGVVILIRTGSKIIGVSEDGREIVSFARLVLHDVKNLRLAASDSNDSSQGTLRIGTTHLQARYALVDVIRRFVAKYPDVDLTLSQGTPGEIAEWTYSGEVDMGISTVPERLPRDVMKLDAYPVHRCVIAPLGHPVLRKKKPTLTELSRYRLIAYDGRFKTGELVERAFASADIAPRTAMRATDADIMKTYVSAGLGIAVIQEMAIDASRDQAIRALNVDHLFPVSMTYIMLRKDRYLRQFMYDLISMVSPKWTKEQITLARGSVR